MNAHDLFELLMRWDVEAKEIPAYLARMGTVLSVSTRRSLLVRRAVLLRVMRELRDTMAGMSVRYRGVIDGVVIIESESEDACWARVKNAGTVEFKLCTAWGPTDAAIAHQK